MKHTNEIERHARALINDTIEFSSIWPTSGKSYLTHLSVYQTDGNRPFAIEYDRSTFINIWVRECDVDLDQLTDIKFTYKEWDPLTDRKQSPWRSPISEFPKIRKGANSNLDSDSWPAFRGYNIYRFKIDTLAKVPQVLDEILRE